jgi:hypothetical protein
MKSGQSHTNPISDPKNDVHVAGLKRVSSAPLLTKLLVPAVEDAKHSAAKWSKTPPASPTQDSVLLKLIEEAAHAHIKKPIAQKPIPNLGKLAAEANVSEVIEQTVSSPEIVKIDKMANDLMKDPLVATQGKDSIVRTLWHILKESTDALFWATKQSTENPINIVHYKPSLFETMRSFALKSAKMEDLFSPEQMIQVHDTTKLQIEANSSKVKSRRFISNKKDIKNALEEIDLKNATVYIPICVGHKEELSTINLEKIISTYLKLKVAKVYVYLGRDAEKNIPADQLAEYSLKRKHDWLAKHSRSQCPSLSNPRVIVMTREELENEKAFQNAQTVASRLFLEDADIEKILSNDTKIYFKRKLHQQQAQQLASTLLPRPLSMRHAPAGIPIPVSVEAPDGQAAASKPVVKRVGLVSNDPSPMSVSSISSTSSLESQAPRNPTPQIPGLEIGAPAEASAQTEIASDDKTVIQSQHPGVDNLTAYIIRQALDHTFKSSDPASVQKCKELFSWLRASSPPHVGSPQLSKEEQPSANKPVTRSIV